MVGKKRCFMLYNNRYALLGIRVEGINEEVINAGYRLIYIGIHILFITKCLRLSISNQLVGCCCASLVHYKSFPLIRDLVSRSRKNFVKRKKTNNSIK